MIVDQLMVSVGPPNLDKRSFRLNDEANLNVYDAELAAGASTVFEQDLKRARRITYQAWKARPWQERLRPAGTRRSDYVICSRQGQLPVLSGGDLLLGALSFGFSDSYQALHSLSVTFPSPSESSFPH